MGRRLNRLTVAGKGRRATERQRQHQSKDDPQDAHLCSRQDDP
jgi:hypothetical protein